MMTKENLVRLQAWLDNELTAEESRQVSQWLSSAPDAQALLQELRETKALLAGNEMPTTLPETREFYWSKIEREILRQESARDRENSPAQAQWWLRLVAPLAGVALLALLATVGPKPFTISRSLAGYFHEIETPLEEMSAISFHSQAAGMTVVWIDSGKDDAEED